MAQYENAEKLTKLGKVRLVDCTLGIRRGWLLPHRSESFTLELLADFLSFVQPLEQDGSL